ncbi:DUF1330 domain-containing protein [Planktotalea sp.]|uniref:DUF1330 domain-containing protein n=1 Tax=Planktotalea sp. TaxID=2029877 RepID=UPI0032976863
MIFAYVSLDITNPASLAEYREVAGDALAKHGGKVESAARAFTVLEGAPKQPDMAAILSFPDKAAAVAWSEDIALQDVHNLRRGSGQSDILLLG